MDAAHLPPLIAQMLRPTFYPHPVSQRGVRLVQTHISYVLLTGRYAYKLKKSVDLGFLDFSTLARRRHFCEEEARLNARGAPGMYLGVVPLEEAAPGTFRFGGGGGGAAVEYAVKMCQFPEDALLGEQLRLGRLAEADVAVLAQIVAAYHQGAPVAAATWGQAGVIRKSIDENYTLTERFTGPAGPQTSEQLAQTRAFTDRFLEGNAELFRRRAAGGFIRECHGDLHLGNICRGDWMKGGPQFLLFDCIEYSDAFRHVDVMYDVAFTAMDLRARGRADLANAFVNAYAECTGDWEGLRVFPLYSCRQAYVRAKVRSLLLEEPEVSENDRRAASGQAADFYRLAWEYTRPRQARVVIMCGLSGSGKSAVARRIARDLDAVHIRSDAVRKHLAGIPLSQRADATVYSDNMTALTYGRLLELAGPLIGGGVPVILDATYLSRARRSEAVGLARRAGVAVTIVHCAAPNDVLRERLSARTGDVADATAALLPSQASSSEPFSDAEKELLVTVDTTRPFDAALLRPAQRGQP